MRHRLITILAFIILLSPFFIPSCLAESTWQAIGPFGGRINSIAVDPNNGQTIYVGTYRGGIFKSTNGGASWNEGGLENKNLTVLVIDPTNSLTIYAGTDGGIFKSTNGGSSWTEANSGLDNTNIAVLVVDPTNSQTIYAGTDTGIYKTTNGSVSWTVAGNGLENVNVTALGIDPTNSQTIYAGTLEGQDCNVYKSTNGGASWTRTRSDLTEISLYDAGYYSFAIDPTNNQTVYAATVWGVWKSTNGFASWTYLGLNLEHVKSIVIDPTNSRTIYVGGNYGVYKSTDSGESWTKLNDGFKYVTSLAIVQDGKKTIYAGTMVSGIFKSANDGGLWRAVNNGLKNVPIYALAMSPTDSQTIYAGSMSGPIFKTTNGGLSWREAHSGIDNRIVYYLAIDPTNGQTIYAGTDIGVYKSIDGSGSWIEANSGLINFNQIYPRDVATIRSLAIDPANNQTIYAGKYGGGVYKSTNGGLSWTVSSNGLTNTYVTFIAVDPISSQTLYAGTDGGGVFKSTNGGVSWINSYAGLSDTHIYSLAINPTNNQIIYAGINNGSGSIIKSTNGGNSWTKTNIGLPSRTILSLAIDQNNNQVIYAGVNATGVYKSANGGESWMEAFSGLAGETIWSLAVDPTNGQTIYAGEFYGGGVYKTLLSDDIPVIMGSSVATFSEGASGSFSVTSSGWPAPEFNLSGTLPSGITFDTATGVLSGTPAGGTAGVYPLIITASNGVPPDATHGVTLTVLPATSLTVSISTPGSGSKPGSLTSITGTASGNGLSKVEIQVSDGTYCLQSNGAFTATPAWLTASGTTIWSLNTSTVTWREGIAYTIQARASAGSANSAPSSSIFTIPVPTSKTGTILSLTLSPDGIRSGESATINGLLTHADTSGVPGQTVTLIIDPPATASNPYPSSVVKMLTTDSSGIFTSGELSVFSVAGVYMIHARFEGNTTFSSSFTSDALAVNVPSGYTIIVTGKAPDNSLLDMHTASTDTIYSTLVNKRGFLPENIQYLRSTASSPVTRQQIQDAITIWARNKLIASPGPLYLIMIDHGSASDFLLDTETLTPDQLKGYLDTLESDPQVIASGTLTTHNRIIMIGACYSGIFTKLSKPGRIVITSANTDEQSIAGFSIFNSGSNTTYYGGEYFIDALFSYLARGDSLKDAFTQSSNMVELRDPRKVSPGTHAGVYDTLAQHPLMDDNGDGKPSYLLGADGTLVVNLQLGVGIRSLGNPADITAVTETTTIPATQTTDTPLWLRVNDNSRIAKAWMEIRTPITSVSSTGGSGQVIPHLITLPLYYDGLQWNGSYSFPNAGKYNILYYTQDNQTNDIAPAKNSVVYRQLASSTAPASFTLTSPNDQEGVSGMFPLTWQEVASPSKITYTLQVATDQSFSTVVYKVENIPQAATYMPKDALKKPGTSQYYCQNGDSYCYWKVTAIDAYGATSTSNTRSFTIVSTNALPGIIKGTVRNATTGVPIAGATITAVNATTAGSNQFTALSNGSFVMMQPSGTYTVTATANGYQIKSLAGIALSSGAVYDAGMNLESNIPITYSVTPSAGSNGTISPTAIQTVHSGATAAFTITPAGGYRTVTPVGGTCPQGTLTGNSYTTGEITGNCAVSASFTPITYSVTPSAGPNGTISPTAIQTVHSGATAAFTITPAGGYRTVTPVGGTCPQGTLSGNSYTTGAITGDCTVNASFTRTSTTGDITGDGKADLVDAITALQVMSNITPVQTYSKEGDVNGDGKIGLPEAIYILQKAAGVR